jgi:hypothetical protein
VGGRRGRRPEKTNEELHTSYASTYNIRVIKSRRMR